MLPYAWHILLLCAASLAPSSSGSYIMTEGFAQHLVDTGRLVKRVHGNLDSGGTKLLTVEYKPPLVMLLRSLRGDADIYVSGNGRTPSTDDYELKSENFSLDLVFVTEDIKPQISALIYASPQCSENVTYVLELYIHGGLLDEYSAIRDELNTHWALPDEAYSESHSSQPSSGSAESSSPSTTKDSESIGSFLYNIMLQLGRLLLFILEVAVET